MPFNSLNQIEGQQSMNYWFGMKITTQFLQPKNGMIGEGENSKPMTFHFNGDDDVWVFVDGKLVLDIGGIHGAREGSIDFSTGEVRVANGQGGTINTSLKSIFNLNSATFDDYTTHKLSFFYLERGTGESNCKIDFNLQTIPEGAIDIAKQITDVSGGNINDFSDAEFTMQVATADTKDGQYAPYANQPYSVYRIGTNPETPGVQPLRTGNTDTEGKFNLKNGEFARLTGQVQHEGDTEPHAITKSMYYTVTELAAGNYDKTDYKFDVKDAKTVTPQGDQIGKSEPLYIDQHPYVTVQNKFDANPEHPKYEFALKKVVKDNSDAQLANRSFTIKVTNGDDEPYSGDFYYKKGDSFTDANGNRVATQNEAKATADNGSIVLKAGLEAHIYGVAPGSTFKVSEETGDSPDYTPSYTCTMAEQDQPCDANAPITVDNTNKSPSVTVTNTATEAPAHRKYIKANGDGTFTLSLDVTGKASSTTSGDGVDVYLLADTTGSMDAKLSDGTTRWDAMKDASKALANSVLTRDNASAGERGVKIAAIPFATVAPAVNTDDNVPQKAVDFTNDATSITSAIDSWQMDKRNQKPKGGTNWQAALEAISAYGNGHGARANAKKIVVFVTDGAPKKPSDSVFTPSLWNESLKSAEGLADQGFAFYNVDVTENNSDSGKNVYIKSGVDSVSHEATSKTDWDNADWALGDVKHRPDSWQLSLKAFSDRMNAKNPGSAQYASTADQSMSDIFKTIVAQITRTDTTYQNVTITDNLSQYAQVTELTPEDVSKATLKVTDGNGNDVTGTSDVAGNYQVSYQAAAQGDATSTGTVTLTFTNNYTLVSGYTYTLNFNVKPTQKATDDYAKSVYGDTKGDPGTDAPGNSTSSGKPGFHTNKEAVLTYSQCVTVSGSGSGSQTKCANGSTQYKHPVLQVGVATANIQLYKQVNGADWTGKGSDGSPQDFSFTLKRTDRTGNTGNTGNESGGKVTYSKSGTQTELVTDGTVSASTSGSIKQGQKQLVGVDAEGKPSGHPLPELTFNVPGTYTFELTEDTTGRPAGWAYDRKTVAVTVVVASGADGKLTANVTYAEGSVQESDAAPTFVNTYTAVSSLPLTGGDASARTWLVFGGLAVLLAAGALAGVNEYRKRQGLLS